MKIGIIGLSQSGKSTLLAAFMGTGVDPETVRQATGVVSVPDPRLDKMIELYHPKKKAYATVVFEDCIPLDTPVKSERIKLYDSLKVMDAFVVVVGAYRCDDTDAVSKEAEKARFELIINDLDFVTKRIERLERETRVNQKDRAAKEKEMEFLKRLQPALEGEESLQNFDFDENEKLIMANYNLVMIKPTLYVLNTSADATPEQNDEQVKAVEKFLSKKSDHSPVIALNANLEAEVAAMDPADVKEFMKEFGIEELGRDRVIKKAYEMLDLITFFTVGEDECRAWTIKKGETALDAAGTIHSDLARGFIRAEVIDYQTLLDLGSIPEARKVGKLRLEGKTYVVKDGEVVHIMFNI